MYNPQPPPLNHSQSSFSPELDRLLAASSASYTPSQTLTTSQLQPNSNNTQNLNSTGGSMFASPPHHTTPWGSSVNDFGSSGRERSHYQSGYLMSSQQNQQAPSQSQNMTDDHPPLLPTKSSLSHTRHSPTHRNAFGYASDFGTDSLFQRSSRKPMLNDEDGPPTVSVMDQPMLVPSSSSTTNRNAGPLFSSTSSPSPFSTPSSPSPTNKQKEKIHYLIIFGFPANNPATTKHYVDVFQHMGDTVPFDISFDSGRGDSNWCKIGYRKEYDAKRALARNGELISDQDGRKWMIGVKWADPAQDLSNTGPEGGDNANALSRTSQAMVPFSSSSTQLAPASSAFKKQEPAASRAKSEPANPQSGGVVATGAPSQGSGWVGTVTDMIFGW